MGGCSFRRTHHELSNLIARKVHGHDHGALFECLSSITAEGDLPTCVIAHTVKGKGVSFMENSVLWHYRSPQGDEFEAAMAELEGNNMRDAFVAALTEIARADMDVMLLTGDLGFGVLTGFAREFPK